MNARVWLLLMGAVAIMSFAAIVLVILPRAMFRTLEPLPGQPVYTAEQASGRAIYVREGCVYCHSQQVRDDAVTTDAARGWGRPSVPAD
ncbi:MAG: cbb3-type cytochrome c oxidase subunit II, partial [Myxococcota bacterium]